MKLKLKLAEPKPKLTPRKSTNVNDDDFAEMRRYICPPPEDLPLLRDHYEGEYFERVDGMSVVRRWKVGNEYFHDFMFYPAKGLDERIELMFKGEFPKDPYLMLLYRLLQKNGICHYTGIPGDVTEADFNKYLSTPTANHKIQLKVKEVPAVTGKLKLKLKEGN